MGCSPPGSSVHEFSRQEYWSGLPFLSPGDLPNPGSEPRSPALQADSLPSEPPGKPHEIMMGMAYYRKLETTTSSAGGTSFPASIS